MWLVSALPSALICAPGAPKSSACDLFGRGVCADAAEIRTERGPAGASVFMEGEDSWGSTLTGERMVGGAPSRRERMVGEHPHGGRGQSGGASLQGEDGRGSTIGRTVGGSTLRGREDGRGAPSGGRGTVERAPSVGKDGRGEPCGDDAGLRQPGTHARMPRAPNIRGRGTLLEASRGSTSLGHLMGGSRTGVTDTRCSCEATAVPRGALGRPDCHTSESRPSVPAGPSGTWPASLRVSPPPALAPARAEASQAGRAGLTDPAVLEAVAPLLAPSWLSEVQAVAAGLG